MSISVSDRRVFRTPAPLRLNVQQRGRPTRVAVMLALVVVWLGGCVTLDRKTPRSHSIALTEAEAQSTTLGGAWAAIAPDDATLSAFRALPNGLEAFAARVALPWPRLVLAEGHFLFQQLLQPLAGVFGDPLDGRFTYGETA